MSSGNCFRQKLALESESIHILREVAAEATNNTVAAAEEQNGRKERKGRKIELE